MFVTAHGSWHVIDGHHVAPIVAFVPMNGDTPATPVNWNDPTVQWRNFLTGFQDNANNDARIGRPTGIAVGPQGSLFVADDLVRQHLPHSAHGRRRLNLTFAAGHIRRISSRAVCK